MRCTCKNINFTNLENFSKFYETLGIVVTQPHSVYCCSNCHKIWGLWINNRYKTNIGWVWFRNEGIKFNG